MDSPIILISAETEWEIAREIVKGEISSSVFGEVISWQVADREIPIFFTGWGKIKAAAACQHIIDTEKPDLIIHLGTCGGFGGNVEVGELSLINKTIIYDIVERIGSQEEAIGHYTVDIDCSFLPERFTKELKQRTMLTADQDIDPKSVDFLRKQYEAEIGDWESGAISYIANLNDVKLLIIKGVSDLIKRQNGTVYGDVNAYREGAYLVMEKIFKHIEKLFSE